MQCNKISALFRGFLPGSFMGILISIVTNPVAWSDSPAKPVFPANYRVHDLFIVTTLGGT